MDTNQTPVDSPSANRLADTNHLPLKASISNAPKPSVLAIWGIAGGVVGFIVAFFAGLATQLVLTETEAGAFLTMYFMPSFFVLIGLAIFLLSRARSRTFPAAKGAMAFGLGLMLTSVIASAPRLYKFLVPVNPADLITEREGYYQNTFAVEGRVIDVFSVNKDDGSTLITVDLQGNSIGSFTIRTTNLSDLPKAGQRVRFFGKGYIDRMGGLFMVEYLRMKK